MKKWLLIFLALCTTTFAQRDIVKFTNSEISEADNYIKPEFGEQLKKVNPDAVKDGLFFLRQKFEDPFDQTEISYQIFQGVPTSKAVNLVKFVVKDLTAAQIAKTKFYTLSDDDESFDVEKIYIDGNNVLVEYGEELYYWKNGSAVSLGVSKEKPYSVAINSTPSAVFISVNGADRGVTPINFNLSGKKPITISAKKDGYYPQQIVEEGTGSDLSINVKLTETISIADPSTELKIKYSQIADGAEQSEINELASKFTKAKSTVESSYKNAQAHAQTNYPALPSKASFESDVAFEKRTADWNNENSAFMAGLLDTKNKIISRLDEGEKRISSIPVKGAYVAEAPIEEPVVEEAPQEEIAQEEYQEDNSIASASDEIYDNTMDDEEIDISDRFSSSDEYLDWTAYSLIGIGVAALVPTTIHILNWNKAETSITDTKKWRDSAEVQSNPNKDKIVYNIDRLILPDIEKSRDTYKSQSIIWGVVSAVTLSTGSILLFSF